MKTENLEQSLKNQGYIPQDFTVKISCVAALRDVTVFQIDAAKRENGFTTIKRLSLHEFSSGKQDVYEQISHSAN